MFIVKIIVDLSAFDMAFDEQNIVVCGKIKSAIAEAEKAIDENSSVCYEAGLVDESYKAMKKRFIKWSNAINGGFVFYEDPMGERRIVEIEEVNYVE